jgi:hypothetical protein
MISEQVVPNSGEDTGGYNIPKLDKKTEKEVEVYITGLSKLLHSKETRGIVLDTLKEGGEPTKTIPHLAMTLNAQMEGRLREKSKPPSLEVLMNGGIFLVGDLIQMAQGVGVLPADMDEQSQQQLLQSTMQQYIEKGLADGTIDPIELQEKTNAMLPEEQRAQLEGIAEQNGYAREPNEMTAMSAYGDQQRRKGMLQGQRMAGGKK